MLAGDRYEWLVTHRFAQWRRKMFGDNSVVHLVQDHERCLWQDRNIAALKAAGCPVVDNYPKSSPDLNAIENVWHKLRQRLEEHAPEEIESRAAFLIRLRNAVNWLNNNCREELLHLCTNQKERAEEVNELKGAKCSW